MFKVHVVDAANSVAYREQLDQYFKLRHHIYVGERGWRTLKRPDGREMDAFDTPDAHIFSASQPLVRSSAAPGWFQVSNHI